MPFLVFRRDCLQSTSGIICGSGSIAVQVGDHFWSGDHLQSGIICGAVQFRNQSIVLVQLSSIWLDCQSQFMD